LRGGEGLVLSARNEAVCLEVGVLDDGEERTGGLLTPFEVVRSLLTGLALLLLGLGNLGLGL